MQPWPLVVLWPWVVQVQESGVRVTVYGPSSFWEQEEEGEEAEEEEEA